MLDWQGVVKLIDLSTAYAPALAGEETPMVCQVGTGWVKRETFTCR